MRRRDYCWDGEHYVSKFLDSSERFPKPPEKVSRIVEALAGPEAALKEVAIAEGFADHHALADYMRLHGYLCFIVFYIDIKRQRTTQ